ncbi:MAG: mechanosensitive ion channel, partial [Lachnospiraceae bacterium]|nr:mechanosensitive ion channel [Lachnospiraceae bacterium]
MFPFTLADHETGQAFVTLTTAIMIVIAIVIGIVLLNINSAIFKRLQVHQKKLHLRFFENVIRIVIVIFLLLWAFSETDMGHRLYQMAFGSTVVLTGVLGLAGKDVLQDIFAGIMLSIGRPFEIGDRILINGVDKACSVEDMTLRHVVLRT